MLADPLPGRLEAAWSVQTDADRLSAAELAERFSLANRDGEAVDG